MYEQETFFKWDAFHLLISRARELVRRLESKELDKGTTEFSVLKAVFEGFVKNGNTEKFYGATHAQVPLKPTTFFTGLSHNVATLLAAKLADGKLSYYMASSASGQYVANSVFWLATRAGKIKRYFPPRTTRFVPANKISPKFKQGARKFSFAEIIFCHGKKTFCDLSDFMEPEKRKKKMKTKK